MVMCCTLILYGSLVQYFYNSACKEHILFYYEPILLVN